MQCTPWDRS
uniref:Uncharacterized protein n=1 Tax=Arundo donax TaxID=35708 RepID=A0A0A8Z4Q8_ARUDO